MAQRQPVYGNNTQSFAISEISKRFSVSENVLEEMCKAGSLPCKIVEGDTGLYYRILVTALPKLRAMQKGEEVCKGCNGVGRVQDSEGSATCPVCKGATK